MDVYESMHPATPPEAAPAHASGQHGHANHAHDQHAGHPGAGGHAGHGDHVAQFRRLFWWSLVPAVPVVALSPDSDTVEREWAAPQEETAAVSPFAALAALKKPS